MIQDQEMKDFSKNINDGDNSYNDSHSSGFEW